MKSTWVGSTEFDGTFQSWRFEGPDCLGPASSDTSDVHIGPDGGTAPVPAKLLPEAGGFETLSQSQPLGLLPAPLRLALVGLCRQKSNWDGVAVVVTRDRTHWVQISADEAVSFQSYLTPALAQNLFAAGAAPDADAVADSLSRPERLATQLSSAGLENAAEKTLGHLIGAELAATRPFWLGQFLVLIGPQSWTQAYTQALKPQGVPAEVCDIDGLLTSGLIALYERDNPDDGVTV